MNLLGGSRALLLMNVETTDWPRFRLGVFLALACTCLFTGCATSKTPSHAETPRTGPKGCVVGDPPPLKWWEYALLPVSVPLAILGEAQRTPGVNLHLSK